MTGAALDPASCGLKLANFCLKHQVQTAFGRPAICCYGAKSTTDAYRTVTDASLRELSGRPKSLAGKSTRPAIWNDLDVIQHIVFDFFRSNIKSTDKTHTEVGGCVYRSLQDRKRCHLWWHHIAPLLKDKEGGSMLKRLRASKYAACSHI